MTDTLTIEHVDPNTILLGSNIRTDPRLTDEFLESVKTRGVHTPCPAVRTASGDLMLVFGSRRRAAAIASGRPLPVFVIGDEDTSRDGQVARLFDQFDENEHREQLTAQEQAAFVQGLLDFKVPVAQIRKRTGLGKDAVAQARTVAASGRVMDAPPIEDLEMAATLAEFDAAGDTEAVEQLTGEVASGPGQFRHAAQLLSDSQPERFQKRDLTAQLTEVGIRLVAEQGDTWQLRISYLRDKDGERITDEQHASCPGHAAYLDSTQERVDSQWRRTWRAAFICTDPDANGHSSYTSRIHGSQEQTPAERQAELAEARRRRAGNAEWRAATKVRRDHITASIVPLTSLPKGWDVQAYRLAVLSGDTYALQYAVSRHHPLGCHWLMGSDDKLNGDRHKLAELGTAATPGRAAVIELVLLLAAAEKQAGQPDAWDAADLGYRDVRADLARYLLFLEATGYALSKIEAHLVHGKKGKYKPQELRGQRADAAAEPAATTAGEEDG
jgi:ParB family transcriptional regulator, chromosome partitioning protein